MKLNQLKALVAVAKAGSIQEAARLMHLTQPALSKSIRELEREVGVPLLVRSAKGATLTPYGTMIAKRSRAIQKEIDKMREELDSLRGELGGRLSIGLTPPAAGPALADAISLFRHQRPSVDLNLLELRPAQILEGLRDGVLDLGIVTQYGEAESCGFKCSRLYGLKTLLAVGGRRPDPKILPHSLCEAEWLVLDLTEEPNGYISSLFARFNLPPPTRVMRCSSMALYLELASRLNAVTHWAETGFEFIEPHFHAGRMTRLELDIPMPELSVLLVYQDEDLLTAAANEFVQMLNSSVSRHHSRDNRIAPT
ncbi:LysR family transcriptional regulator [Paraburkholderia sp. RP-4-7]|uniref:LysR family transcriptional regulator n=1 Tax=Paraburkholderia polaris TaxID=2728848 RepID=A0A848IW18_9BURK|nr:LysR family transcriptional regulator [Paraburkholderia polaris]NMM04054.1 LysR family transcriptional regulator [Paraburkholderia polaris]